MDIKDAREEKVMEIHSFS